MKAQCCVIIGLLAMSAPGVQAGPFRMLVESNEDRNAGAEVFQASFGDYGDLLDANSLDAGFTDINIGPNFNIAGLAYDGAYRLLVESNEDRNGGAELFAATFDTFEDLSNANSSDTQFTQVNIGPNFSVGGLAYDGSYRLLLESDEDRNGGAEVFAATFASFTDLLSSNASDSAFSQINIGPNFNLAGLAFDGIYRMLVESIEDRNAGAEVFSVDFLSFDALMSSTQSDAGFTNLNIGPNFNTRGLAFEQNIAVDAPDNLSLLGLGVLSLVGLRIGRRRLGRPSRVALAQ